MGVDRQRLRVLVAEDGRLNRIFLERILMDLGIDCDVAENGLEAVKACARQAYDFVFMDCLMPVMDGYEAAKTIRREKGSSIHIVAVTGSDSPEDRNRCLASGMDQVLVKPVSPKDIQKCLNLADQECLSAQGVRKAETTLEKAVRLLMEDSGLDREFCVQMAAEFCSLADSLMEDMVRVRAKRDAVALGRLLHQLKGTAGNVRVLSVSEAAKAGEQALAAGDWEAVDNRLAHIAEAIASMALEKDGSAQRE